MSQEGGVKRALIKYSNVLHSDHSVNTNSIYNDGAKRYKGAEKSLSPSDVVAIVMS